jgi:diguanylate cyclase (GGDEF)-like protein
MTHNKSIDTNKALSIVKELDRALAMHQQWLKDFHRMIICQEPGKMAYTRPDAHLTCEFGRWFNTLPESLLAGLPNVQQLAGPHKQMHDAARQLLQLLHQESASRQTCYETFVDASLDFKLAIRHCQSELLQQICTVDHLTGAWNRHTMEARLHEETERVRRGTHSCSLSIVDLDHFKLINDQYGHPAGDKVLSEVAGFLMKYLRAYDITFRYGGEEFLLCLPDTRLHEAEQFLNRIRENLAAHEIEIGAGQIINVSASFGVTQIGAEESISDAISRADHALLCAKARGRNCVCAWDIGVN